MARGSLAAAGAEGKVQASTGPPERRTFRPSPMPNYCRRCVLPDTRPGVSLDAEGVCRGCRNAERKRAIDWRTRAAAFRALVEEVRALRRDYDCVVPVSGGKDSFWQVVTCLDHGLRPLCVTYRVPGRTPLGERNLRALVRLGVDHVDFQLDPEIERRFIAKAFRRTGIGGLVTHMAIYAWPARVAMEKRIPLVLYGENSAFEYGTDDDRLTGAAVDGPWLRKFGVTEGTTARDWADDDLPERALRPLMVSTDAELREAGVSVRFLGHYFPWDPENSRRIASARGFAASEKPRVGHYDFVNIDDDMIGVHHHTKWHKFGITRTWDTLSMEIRAGRLSREAAIGHLASRGDETPWEDIERFCAYTGLSRGEYFEIAERFRSHDLWSRRDGRWVIEGFLIPDFDWSQVQS